MNKTTRTWLRSQARMAYRTALTRGSYRNTHSNGTIITVLWDANGPRVDFDNNGVITTIRVPKSWGEL